MTVQAWQSGWARCEFGARTDVGRVRTRNEDALHVDSLGRYAVLADGMGGHRGGDVAARIAVKTLNVSLDAGLCKPPHEDEAESVLFDAILTANAAIYAFGRANPRLAGMGCTVVTAVFLKDAVVSAHVGDSRLYRLRESELKQLTRDHTMLQEQIDGGIISAEEARGYSYRGLLTRGLGVADEVSPELGVHDAIEGDVFLLCSDGLTDMLDEQDVAAALMLSSPVADIANLLVQHANEHGGRDNVSVIVGRLVV